MWSIFFGFEPEARWIYRWSVNQRFPCPGTSYSLCCATNAWHSNITPSPIFANPPAHQCLSAHPANTLLGHWMNEDNVIIILWIKYPMSMSIWVYRLLVVIELYVNHNYQEENFNWNFAISLMANLLNLKSAYNCIFRNLSMIANIIIIKTSELYNIQLREFDKFEPGR